MKHHYLVKTAEKVRQVSLCRPLSRPGIVGMLIGAAAGVGYIACGTGGMSAPVGAAPQIQALQSGQPLAPLALPAGSAPIDQSDAIVCDLLRQVSAHPRSSAWLVPDSLIRTVVVAVVDAADGRTPANRLPLLRLSSRFRVVERGATLYIDPRSYERYNGLAAAAASIDVAGGARLYAMLKPRIEEAYHDLGTSDTPFDRTLEHAIVMVLATPVLDAPVRVEPRRRGYGFGVQELEGLPAAQRQLLRAGPRNVRIIQMSLRRLAEALGIPAQRLPAPRS